jgi:hypothetical protein
MDFADEMKIQGGPTYPYHIAWGTLLKISDKRNNYSFVFMGVLFSKNIILLKKIKDPRGIATLHAKRLYIYSGKMHENFTLKI